MKRHEYKEKRNNDSKMKAWTCILVISLRLFVHHTCPFFSLPFTPPQNSNRMSNESETPIKTQRIVLCFRVQTEYKQKAVHSMAFNGEKKKNKQHKCSFLPLANTMIECNLFIYGVFNLLWTLQNNIMKSLFFYPRISGLWLTSHCFWEPCVFFGPNAFPLMKYSLIRI